MRWMMESLSYPKLLETKKKKDGAEPETYKFLFQQTWKGEERILVVETSARVVVVNQQTQPSFSLLPSYLSNFNGTILHSQVLCKRGCKRRVWHTKGALQVSASWEHQVCLDFLSKRLIGFTYFSSA